jgi:hypothetical protein
MDVGGYPKNSDDSPNTREKVLSTFKHKVRALRDSDSPADCTSPKKSESVYTCPHAPFYREMKELLHSKTPSSSENIPSVNAYKNVFLV